MAEFKKIKTFFEKKTQYLVDTLYQTPLNEFRAQKRGQFPYKCDKTVPFVASSFHHLTDHSSHPQSGDLLFEFLSPRQISMP